MTPKNREKIQAALNRYEQAVREDGHRSNAQKNALVSLIRQSVEKLEALAQEIRALYPLAYAKLPQTTESGKPMLAYARNDVYHLMHGLVVVGQGYSSMFFGFNLRDDVLEVIERTYGVCFSGLKVHSEATDKETGEKVYLAFDGRGPYSRGEANPGITLFQQGEYKFLKLNEFQEKYDESK